MCFTMCFYYISLEYVTKFILRPICMFFSLISFLQMYWCRFIKFVVIRAKENKVFCVRHVDIYWLYVLKNKHQNQYLITVFAFECNAKSFANAGLFTFACKAFQLFFFLLCFLFFLALFLDVLAKVF